LDVLKFIVENVGGMIDIIELLNEPAGFENDQWANVIRQFWQDGYDVVRQAVGGGLKIMIGNGFLDLDVRPPVQTLSTSYLSNPRTYLAF
jgi:glucan 1,3-beta-glucosidase